MKRYASIDIGTQTIRLLVAEVDNSGKLIPVFRDRSIVRLGEGMAETKRLHKDSIKRALTCLINFNTIALKHAAEKTVAVATACVRQAENGKQFLDDIYQKTGITARLLSGEEEASLALKGVLSVFDNNKGDFLIMDIGGGSTEFIVTKHGTVSLMESLPLGVVYLTEKHLFSDPPLSREITTLKEKVFTILFANSSVFKKITPEMRHKLKFIGTAGTVTTLAAMDLQMTEYEPDKINGHLLTRSAIENLYQKMIDLPSRQRKKIPGLEPGREIVIIAGTVIVLAAMYLLDTHELRVSDAGLLEGILLNATG